MWRGDSPHVALGTWQQWYSYLVERGGLYCCCCAQGRRFESLFGWLMATQHCGCNKGLPRNSNRWFHQFSSVSQPCQWFNLFIYCFMGLPKAHGPYRQGTSNNTRAQKRLVTAHYRVDVTTQSTLRGAKHSNSAPIMTAFTHCHTGIQQRKFIGRLVSRISASWLKISIAKV